MNRPKQRKYFIVKHGLDSLIALPTYVWRTEISDEPRAFKRVNVGDRWIAFAYTSSDERERPLSLVTGFYECTRASWYGDIPRRGLPISRGETKAWMIKGKPVGKDLGRHVGVPPIDDLLGKPTFKGQTFVPIKAKDFKAIRLKVLAMGKQLDPKSIPLLMREPRFEQELLAIVVCGHKTLGIEKITRVRKAFPDLQVKLKGKREEVHLELEMYSKGFVSHGHSQHVDNLGRYPKTDDVNEPRRSVAVLCWIDNEKGFTLRKKSPKAKDYVHKVYELQTLLRDRRQIRW